MKQKFLKPYLSLYFYLIAAFGLYSAVANISSHHLKTLGTPVLLDYYSLINTAIITLITLSLLPGLFLKFKSFVECEDHPVLAFVGKFDILWIILMVEIFLSGKIIILEFIFILWMTLKFSILLFRKRPIGLPKDEPCDPILPEKTQNQ